MKCKACLLFWCAFLGAIVMFIFRLAATFRCNREAFHCPCFGEFLAQVFICFVVTILTFVPLWHKEGGSHKDVWTAYFDGFTHAALLELIIQLVAGK